MIVFTLKQSPLNGLYAVYENGVKVKNPIYFSVADFEQELRELNFSLPYTIKSQSVRQYLNA